MTKTYTVFQSFDLKSFLDSTRAGGVKLSALDKDEIVNGSISLSGSELTVSICEVAGGREEPSSVDGWYVVNSLLI